jgi:hypothetical protein
VTSLRDENRGVPLDELELFLGKFIQFSMTEFEEEAAGGRAVAAAQASYGEDL